MDEVREHWGRSERTLDVVGEAGVGAQRRSQTVGGAKGLHVRAGIEAYLPTNIPRSIVAGRLFQRAERAGRNHVQSITMNELTATRVPSNRQS